MIWQGEVSASISPRNTVVENCREEGEFQVYSMTQKSALFKGQQKKFAAPNRHGKQPHIRKGKQFKAPSKKGKDWDVNKEVTKFIDTANELKAATQASKEGARLRLVKAPEQDANATTQKNVKKKNAVTRS